MQNPRKSSSPESIAPAVDSSRKVKRAGLWKLLAWLGALVLYLLAFLFPIIVASDKLRKILRSADDLDFYLLPQLINLPWHHGLAMGNPSVTFAYCALPILFVMAMLTSWKCPSAALYFLHCLISAFCLFSVFGLPYFAFILTSTRLDAQTGPQVAPGFFLAEAGMLLAGLMSLAETVKYVQLDLAKRRLARTSKALTATQSVPVPKDSAINAAVDSINIE